MHIIASNWIVWLATPANWLVVLAVAGGLGFVIFVHELGHFLVAKACGVKCEKFYLGFDIYGLKLCKFQWGETEYGIGILPLGGYVKMLGQDDNPANLAEENRRARVKAELAQAGADGASASATAEHAPPLTHGDLPPEPVSDPHAPYDPRSYMAQSVPKRMAIISAGVIMNVIFAFIMATIAYGLGVPETPCIVGGSWVGGAAWQADLQPGDKITRIGNVNNPRFDDLRTGVTLGDVEKGIPFTIDRAADSKSEDIKLFPDSSLGLPMIGITSAQDAQLIDRPGFHATFPFSAARRSTPAFEPGDTIVQVNDTPVHSYRDFDRALAKYIAQPLEVTVERKAEQGSANDSSAKRPDGNETAKKVTITVEPTPLRDFGLIMPLGPIKALQKDSPAEKAGLQTGDRIVAVDGKPVGNPFTLESRLLELAKAGKPVSFEIEPKTIDASEKSSAAATKRVLQITLRVPEFVDIFQDISPLPLSALGVACEVPTTVAGVQPDSPAASADIQSGDEIISEKLLAPPKRNSPDLMDDEEPPPAKTVDFGKQLTWPGYVLEVLPTLDPATKVQLEVMRGDKTHTVELALSELKNEAGKIVYSPYRGFNLAPTTIMHKTESWGQAARAGATQTIDALLMVYRFLQKIGGQIPVTMLSGPVGIIQQAGFEAQQGFAKFLLFLTLLSANLAVVNFLPIPVLDGGHMVFLIYEGLRGKPASERIIVAFTYAGMLFLLTLMSFVLLLDIGAISRH
jgi:regulator of sigma E protease